MDKVRVDIFEKPCSLKYDINALSELENACGASIVNLLSNEENMQKISTMRYLWWAGLLHEEPKLTLKEVGDRLQYSLNNGVQLVESCEYLLKAIDSCGILESNGNAEAPVMEKDTTGKK